MHKSGQQETDGGVPSDCQYPEPQKTNKQTKEACKTERRIGNSNSVSFQNINQALINSNIHCSFIEQEKYTGSDKSTAKKTKGNIFGSFLCPNEVDNNEYVLVG